MMPSSGPQIISLHSKRYQPSGMLIHRQNSHAPRGKQLTGSREPVSSLYSTYVFGFIRIFLVRQRHLSELWNGLSA
jgi:hypothetical protein